MPTITAGSAALTGLAGERSTSWTSRSSPTCWSRAACSGGADFAAALQALCAASCGAHFLVKRERGAAPKVMPLEALWWVDEPEQQDIVEKVALGLATMADSARERWRWQDMIMQPA